MSRKLQIDLITEESKEKKKTIKNVKPGVTDEKLNTFVSKYSVMTADYYDGAVIVESRNI